MGERTHRTAQTILLATVLVRYLLQGAVVGSPGSNLSNERDVMAQLPSMRLQASDMVDNAIQVLSKGWKGMSEAEREEFLRFYDPGNTGEIDQKFVDSVIKNYRRIDRKLDGHLLVKHEQESRMCVGMRLYYTEFVKIHVCPYIEVETSQSRMARDLVHEVAHMALLVVDRAYYYPDFSPYEALTPRGHWTAQLPLVGHLFREIARADTLYHPDAFSNFAMALTMIQAEEGRASRQPHQQATAIDLTAFDAADRKFFNELLLGKLRTSNPVAGSDGSDVRFLNAE